MDESLMAEMLEDAIDMFIEDEDTGRDYESFRVFIEDYIPQEALMLLGELNGADEEEVEGDGDPEKSFLYDIWTERFEEKEEEEEDEVDAGCCSVCDRKSSLTRHHVHPRETWPKCKARGIDQADLEVTIPVCRMCHKTIHRFFKNDELASKYHSLPLLLEDEKFERYAHWASKQKVAGTMAQKNQMARKER